MRYNKSNPLHNIWHIHCKCLISSIRLLLILYAGMKRFLRYIKYINKISRKGFLCMMSYVDIKKQMHLFFTGARCGAQPHPP